MNDIERARRMLIKGWSDALRSHTPEFVLGLIILAHGYEPRLGETE